LGAATVKMVIPSLHRFIGLQSVTDTQTDGQTDRCLCLS